MQQDTQDLGPQFQHIRNEMTPTPPARPSGRSYASEPLFQLTEVAKKVAASRAEKKKNREAGNLAKLAVDASFYNKYQPRQSALAQLVDLEEDMANDGFDYSIFLKKEVNSSLIPLLFNSFPF